MKKSDSSTSFEMVLVLVAVVALGSWVANIYKLIDGGFTIAQWGGMEVCRVVGIFVAPLGAVLGWF